MLVVLPMWSCVGRCLLGSCFCRAAAQQQRSGQKHTHLVLKFAGRYCTAADEVLIYCMLHITTPATQYTMHPISSPLVAEAEP